MRFNFEPRDGRPLVGSPAIGDVYPVRGGRGLRYGHQHVVVAINEEQRMAYSLTIDRNGVVVGVYSIGLHVLEETIPIARVDGLEQLEFLVRSL